MLSQAEEARTQTNKAETKEKVEIEVAGSYGTDGNIDLEKLNENLQHILDIKKYENGEATKLTNENPIEGLPAEVKVDKYIFEISEKGIVNEKGLDTEPPVEEKVNPGEIVKESNKTYTDVDGDTAVIPVGFAIVPGLEDISEGLVISDNVNDKEIEGEAIVAEGNQFVWIPVKDAESYKTNEEYEDLHASTRTQNDIGYLPVDDADIGIEDSTDDEQKRELTFAKEKKMVTDYMIQKYEVGGFYLSRYEAGKENTDTLISKKGANVWVDIPQETAKETAKTLVVEDNTKVKSALCTGIQWDMVMEFVNRKNDEGNPSQEFNVIQYSTSRHIGSKASSGQNEADKVCNIYDLEGNFYEYVAEKNTWSNSYFYIFRGGDYDSYISASNRYCGSGNADSGNSFRFVLYVM